MTLRAHGMFAIVATLVVGAVAAWGFYLVGAPSTRRAERFDEQRLQDLQTIAREIQAMVVDPLDDERKLKAPLPQTLAEAAERARSQRVNPRDPETGQPYTYTLKSETSYELCAEFAQRRDSDRSVFWNHPPGRHCFTVDVLDPPPFY